MGELLRADESFELFHVKPLVIWKRDKIKTFGSFVPHKKILQGLPRNLNVQNVIARKHRLVLDEMILDAMLHQKFSNILSNTYLRTRM